MLKLAKDFTLDLLSPLTVYSMVPFSRRKNLPPSSWFSTISKKWFLSTNFEKRTKLLIHLPACLLLVCCKKHSFLCSTILRPNFWQNSAFSSNTLICLDVIFSVTAFIWSTRNYNEFNNNKYLYLTVQST